MTSALELDFDIHVNISVTILSIENVIFLQGKSLLTKM